MAHPQSFERILFAGASARWACQTAKLTGIVPVAADLFCDQDTQHAAELSFRLGDFEALLPIMRNLEVDAFVILGGMENSPDLVSKLELQIPILGSSAASLVESKSHAFLESVLKENFPLSKKTLTPSDQNHAWIQKPIRSSGGWQIKNVDAWPQFTPSSGYFFQEKVPGETFGAIFLSNGCETVFLGATLQLSGFPFHNNPFAYCGSVGPVEFSTSTRDRIENIGRGLAAAISARGIFGLDIVIDSSNPENLFVVDVNLRLTSSVEIIQKSLGASANLIRMHLDASQERALNEATLPDKDQGVFGKAVLFNQAQETLTITDEFLQRLTLARPELEVADIPVAGTVVAPGHPILTVFATGRATALAISSLNKKREQIHDLLAN